MEGGLRSNQVSASIQLNTNSYSPVALSLAKGAIFNSGLTLSNFAELAPARAHWKMMTREFFGNLRSKTEEAA